MRIDAHQHFWSLSRDDYGWLTPDLGVLYRDHGPADLFPLLQDAGIDKTILVQAAPTVEETRYLLALAAENDYVAGVVGWVDLEDEVAAAGALDEFTQHESFVGVRPMLQDMSDPAWIARKALQPAVDRLIANNTCFDALVRPAHLPYLLDFLGRNRELKCVIDHGAKPQISKGDWQPWAGLMAQLAEQTNAYCKLSGLVTEAAPDQTSADLLRYVDYLLETFGAERLIWGSDWPVLTLASSYADWNAATDSFLSALTDEEVQLVRGQNAVRFYGLTAEGES
ncbi:MAG: amidohydrolase family protein [Pseudomonadota bacterium]